MKNQKEPRRLDEGHSQAVELLQQALWRIQHPSTNAHGYPMQAGGAWWRLKQVTEWLEPHIEKSGDAHVLQKKANLTWSSALQCGWSAWRVMGDGELALNLAPGQCCDMSGAIRVAEAMMPGVWRIATFAGDVPDTEYRNWRGEWRAYKPPSNA